MKLTRKTFLALVPAALLLAACGGSDDPINVADPRVRFVHAAQLAPNVTLFRNDLAQSDANNVGYRYASRYFDVETGTATWRVATAAGSAEVGTLAFDARRGHKYSLLALPGSPAVEVMLIDDPFNRGLSSNDPRVRVLHASFNAQTVDVYLTPASTNIATVQPNFSTVAYKAALPASGEDSIAFVGAAYQLRITVAGTKSVIFSAPITLANDEDWLLTTVPSSLVPNAIKVLAVRADDPSRSAVEIASQ